MTEVSQPVLAADEGRPDAAALIDCDVHAYCANGLHDVLPYMPDAWRRRFTLKGLDLNEDALSYRFANPHEGGALRRDARPPGGGPSGSDPAFVATHHLDRYGIGTAMINSLQALSLAAVQAQVDESVVLCEAFNEYFIETWLPVDGRYVYGAVIPAQDPLAAARQIRALGARDRVVSLYFPLLSIPMGHRFFHPIYEAAEEVGLPIVVHPSSVDFIFQGAGVNPVGWPESYAQMYSGLPMLAWGSLESLVLTGTLEMFPRLKLAFIEFGFTWAPPALWRMDKAWQSCRFEVPWVTKRPSEYVAEQVWFGTQPADEPANPGHLDQMIAMLGDDRLLLCSDYPHWDGDPPDSVFHGLDQAARNRIMVDNATAFFDRTAAA